MGEKIENVWVPDRTLAVIAWIQDCFEKLEMGREDLIVRDPWAIREPPLTDEEVETVFQGICYELDYEMKQSPAHHLNRSGATEFTGLERMGKEARRAMVEGCDYLIRTVAEDEEPRPEYPAGQYNYEYEGWYC